MGFRVVVVHGGSEFVSLVMAGQFGFRWMTTLHGEVAIWLEVWWLWWLIVVGGAFFIVLLQKKRESEGECCVREWERKSKSKERRVRRLFVFEY